MSPALGKSLPFLRMISLYTKTAIRMDGGLFGNRIPAYQPLPVFHKSHHIIRGAIQDGTNLFQR